MCQKKEKLGIAKLYQIPGRSNLQCELSLAAQEDVKNECQKLYLCRIFCLGTVAAGEVSEIWQTDLNCRGWNSFSPSDSQVTPNSRGKNPCPRCQL